MSWDGINILIDFKDGMQCNIPWSRWDGSLGGVRSEFWRHLLFYSVLLYVNYVIMHCLVLLNVDHSDMC